MENTSLTPGLILNTLFLHTKENPRYFSDQYLDRDRTLVYKWMNDSVGLPKKHVANIVRFTLEQTGEPERLQIRNELQRHLTSSRLCLESQAAIAETEDFGQFLHSLLLHSISVRIEDRRRASDGAKGTASEIFEAGTSPIETVVCAVLASAGGGTIWNLCNQVFHWQFFMGGSGNEPNGLASVVWGIVTLTPVVVFALSSLGKAGSFISLRTRILLVTLFAFCGGAGAGVFYNSGFRAYIERFGLSYGLQEGAIAGVYAFVVGVPPLITVFLLVRQSDIWPRSLLLGIVSPSVVTALVAFSTWLIGRSEIETAQLRGFVVGLTLRLVLYILIRLYCTNGFTHKGLTSSKRSLAIGLTDKAF